MQGGGEWYDVLFQTLTSPRSTAQSGATTASTAASSSAASGRNSPSSSSSSLFGGGTTAASTTQRSSLALSSSSSSSASNASASAQELKSPNRPFERFYCHQTVDQVILECVQAQTSLVLSDPVGLSQPKVSLDRLKGDLHESFPYLPTDQAFEAYGCLGIMHLISACYLVLITQREEVGRIGQAVVWKATKCTVVPIPRSSGFVDEEEKRTERNYLKYLTSFLDDAEFYFSFDYDLTRNSQYQYNMTPQEKALPLWQRVDTRFFWNRFISQDLIAQNLHNWILPVMDGFIEVKHCSVEAALFDYIIISRRSCTRTGARFQTRGADPMGEVANFVETEQLVLYGKVVSSFVQTRGSIPVIWHQKGKGLKPKPIVENSLFTRSAFQAHFEAQIRYYGDQVLVNLINQSGPEHDVGEAYEAQVNLLNHPQITYFPFDFHERCKNMRYENLAYLMSQVQPGLEKAGYFWADAEGVILRTQTGVVRTNCIDCLDRTNVVQSQIARHMLVLQLKTLGILSFMSIEELPELDFMLKNVWADNADFMSKQYTGTGALKTDYTRTGKRSVKGTMTDGVNSAKRFVNKQFKDDYKQMSMDLFLGRFLVQRRAYDPSLSPALSNMQHVMTSTSPESNNTAAQQQPTLAKADRELQFSALILLSAEDPSDPYEARSGERHPAILELCPAKNSPRGLDNTNPFLTEVEGSSDGEIVSYVIPLRSTKQFAFSSLRQVIIHPRFHRLVGLLFAASARPYYYIFSSVKERAQFIQSIQSYIPDLPQFPGTSADLLPSLSPSLQDAQWAEKLGVFVGTWDLADQGPALNLSWISKGHNLYVIGVQNCFYQPPQEVVSSCRAHWIYVLQAYLGLQYSLLVSTTNPTEGTALVVLARNSSYTKVTNLKVQNVEERRAPKDFFGISNTASAPTQGEKKTVKDRISPFVNKFAKRLESSFATQAANFSLGTPEAAPDSPVSRSTEGRTIGDCISFFFNGTSFCFINSKRGTAPKLPAAIKMDLFSDFDHVFWMGCDINSSNNNNSKSSSWTELVAQPPQGSILWRSLPDCNLTKLQPLTHSNVVIDQQQNPFQAQTTPSSASSSSEKHYPLSASFSVTTRHICGQLDHNLGLSLVFYDLKGHNFAASDIGKGEYCILFEAPFFEEGFRTSFQNVSSLSWQDNVELPILFPQQGYIRRHSVRLTVVDRGSLSSDGTTIGVCIVSLRKLSLLSQQSFEFREAVVYNDQTCGWISGTICATKRDVSAQKGNLHRSSASSPSSSYDSQQHNARFRPYSMQLPPVTTTTGGSASGSPSATSPRKHPAAARAQSLPHFHASNISLLDSPSPDFMTNPSSSSSSFASPSSPFPLSSSSGYPSSYQPQFQHQDYGVPPSSYFASSQPSSSQFYSSGSTIPPPSSSSPYTSSSSSSPYFGGSAPSSPFSSQQQQPTLQPVPYSPQPPPLAFTLPPSFSQQFPQQ